MLKRFALQLGVAGAAAWFDTFNLDIADEDTTT